MVLDNFFNNAFGEGYSQDERNQQWVGLLAGLGSGLSSGAPAGQAIAGGVQGLQAARGGITDQRQYDQQQKQQEQQQAFMMQKFQQEQQQKEQASKLEAMATYQNILQQERQHEMQSQILGTGGENPYSAYRMQFEQQIGAMFPDLLAAQTQAPTAAQQLGAVPAPAMAQSSPANVPAPTAQPVNGNIPLGIRNNNFGNIRGNYHGAIGTDDKGFAQYATPEDGVKAVDRQLGLYHKRGNNTVAGMISTWAPPNENPTAQYIENVAQWTGINPNDVVTEEQIPAIRDAIIKMETGYDASTALNMARNKDGIAVDTVYDVPPLKAANFSNAGQMAGSMLRGEYAPSNPQELTNAITTLQAAGMQEQAKVLTDMYKDLGTVKSFDPIRMQDANGNQVTFDRNSQVDQILAASQNGFQYIPGGYETPSETQDKEAVRARINSNTKLYDTAFEDLSRAEINQQIAQEAMMFAESNVTGTLSDIERTAKDYLAAFGFITDEEALSRIDEQDAIRTLSSRMNSAITGPRAPTGRDILIRNSLGSVPKLTDNKAVFKYNVERFALTQEYNLAYNSALVEFMDNTEFKGTPTEFRKEWNNSPTRMQLTAKAAEIADRVKIGSATPAAVGAAGEQQTTATRRRFNPQTGTFE